MLLSTLCVTSWNIRIRTDSLVTRPGATLCWNDWKCNESKAQFGSFTMLPLQENVKVKAEGLHARNINQHSQTTCRFIISCFKWMFIAKTKAMEFYKTTKFIVIVKLIESSTLRCTVWISGPCSISNSKAEICSIFYKQLCKLAFNVLGFFLSSEVLLKMNLHELFLHSDWLA